MRYFDFTQAYMEAYAAAQSDVERYQVRTRVGQEQFGPALTKARVVQIRKGESSSHILGENHLIIMGVVTWSDPDLQALDDLIWVSKNRAVSLLVFDLDECQNMEDIREFIPEAETVGYTPVVAQYRKGKLVMFDQGQSAIYWLEQF